MSAREESRVGLPSQHRALVTHASPVLVLLKGGALLECQGRETHTFAADGDTVWPVNESAFTSL